MLLSRLMIDQLIAVTQQIKTYTSVPTTTTTTNNNNTNFMNSMHNYDLWVLPTWNTYDNIVTDLQSSLHASFIKPPSKTKRLVTLA